MFQSCLWAVCHSRTPTILSIRWQENPAFDDLTKAEQLIKILFKLQYGQVQYPNGRNCSVLIKGQMCHNIPFYHIEFLQRWPSLQIIFSRYKGTCGNEIQKLHICQNNCNIIIFLFCLLFSPNTTCDQYAHRLWWCSVNRVTLADGDIYKDFCIACISNGTNKGVSRQLSVQRYLHALVDIHTHTSHLGALPPHSPENLPCCFMRPK